MNSVQNTTKPLVSIGIPVYNGEKFIRKRLENILSQTYSNFELIISDNASTDMTSKIYHEFISKYNHIKYFKQENNVGGIKNYQFVLSKAKTKYFVFAPVDDMWNKTFLEKNVSILEKDDSIVGSIGKIEWYGKNVNDKFSLHNDDTLFQKYYKRIRKKFQHHGADSIKETTFEKRAAIFLRKLQTQNPSFILYSVFRTNALQKSIQPKKFLDEFYHSFWNNVCVSILEYGGIHLIDEILIYYNTDGGGYGVTPITQFKKNQISLVQCIIPWSGQISWFVHKFGLKFFLKYFIDFLGLFIMGEVIFFLSIFKELKK